MGTGWVEVGAGTVAGVGIGAAGIKETGSVGLWDVVRVGGCGDLDDCFFKIA